LSEVGNDFGSGSLPFGNQAGLFFGGCHRISVCLDVVADPPSPLKTSRDLRSAAGRCEPAHRDFTFAIAEVWLSLARQQEAMVELLAIWTEAHSRDFAEHSPIPGRDEAGPERPNFDGTRRHKGLLRARVAASFSPAGIYCERDSQRVEKSHIFAWTRPPRVMEALR
jgi:hypothetical protein